MLAEVLRAGKYSERAVYDVRSAAKPREGDVNVAQIGRDAKMPWQTDGRRWHN